MYFLFVLGCPIKECRAELEWFLDELKSFRDVGSGFWHRHFQGALDLLSQGYSEERYEDFMGKVWYVEEEGLYERDERSFDAWTSFVHFLAVTILGDPRSQQDVAETCKHLLNRPIHGADMACTFLWDALAAVSVLPEQNVWTRRKLRRVVRRRLKSIKMFTVYSREFCHGKACLLEAELAALSPTGHHRAILSYDSAIALSASANLFLDEAIATERAGRFLAKIGRDSEATEYINQAITAYERYGAVAKTEQLSQVLSLTTKTSPSVPAN